MLIEQIIEFQLRGPGLPSQYLNCRGDASPHRELASPHRDLGVPPSRFERCMIRQKLPNSSPNFGEKPLQFPAKTI